MHLLPKNSYWKVMDPLSKVKVNHLFARFVAEKQVNGTIYVDDSENPAAFYILHPYGMSMLFGDTGHDAFNTSLRNYMLNTNSERKKEEWLQASGKWNTTIGSQLGKALIKAGQADPPSGIKVVEEYTRANLRFSATRYRVIIAS